MATARVAPGQAPEGVNGVDEGDKGDKGDKEEKGGLGDQASSPQNRDPDDPDDPDDPGFDLDLDPDDPRAAKAQQIRDACVRGDRAQLQALAESPGGFLTDALRQIAWPFLLGLPVGADGRIDARAAAAAAGIPPDDGPAAWEALPPHRDEEQVQLDVHRAFVHYPRYAPPDEARQKAALSALIVEVLRRHPALCYFQGFHDICQVLLLVLPPPLRVPAVVRLALLRIRDFMLPTIEPAVQQLQLLPDLVRRADPALWRHLRRAQHPQPFFALSGTLTMYAHDVPSLAAIARVFDVLLARDPSFSLYLFAAIVCAHRDALFATPADEPEMLHHILSKLPARAAADPEGKQGKQGKQGKDGREADPPLDDLVAAAARLAAAYPPPSLPAWRALPAASVLKAGVGRNAAHHESVADGERLFDEHVRALARAARRRQQAARARQLLVRARGPLRAAGVAAVLVAVLAVALRRAAAGGGGGGGAVLPWALPSPVAAWLARLGRLRHMVS